MGPPMTSARYPLLPLAPALARSRGAPRGTAGGIADDCPNPVPGSGNHLLRNDDGQPFRTSTIREQ
jgi:hypothetical protein